MFSMRSVSKNPSTATFHLSPAASLNLGRSQNGILGKGLTHFHTMTLFDAPGKQAF